MALSIKNDEVDRLARELSERRGETITQTILAALREQLAREISKKPSGDSDLVDDLMMIARRCAELSDLDRRSEDEILGYDEQGIPAR